MSPSRSKAPGPTRSRRHRRSSTRSAWEQKQIGTIAFDSDERFDWNFVPLQDKERKATRKGIPFEKLTADQKQKALALLKAGTSQSGNETAKAIMNLENVLKEAEKMGAMVRTPEWYFVTIFKTIKAEQHREVGLAVRGASPVGQHDA